MCEITGATKVKGNIYLGCTGYDGDFMKARLLRIYDESGNKFETADFVMEKTRTCFTTQTTPWIMLKDDVPSIFLHKGNKIEFDFN